MLVAVDPHEVVRGAVTFVSDPESRWLEWTEPGELQFRLLAVDVSARAHGIGAAFVHGCLERAGDRPVLIHTTRWMEAAQRLYERLGFVRRRRPRRAVLRVVRSRPRPRSAAASGTARRSSPTGSVGLVELEEVAERVVQERLLARAGDVRDRMHVHAPAAEVGDGRVEVVDADREVVAAAAAGRRLCIRCTCCPPASSQWPGPRSGRGSGVSRARRGRRRGRRRRRSRRSTTWWIPAGRMANMKLTSVPPLRTRLRRSDVGALDGKVIAVTGAGTRHRPGRRARVPPPRARRSSSTTTA